MNTAPFRRPTARAAFGSTLVAVLTLALSARADGAPRPPAANRPPTVTISGPDAGDTFKANATITVRAQAKDPDGTVTFVRFWAASGGGSILIGTDTSAQGQMFAVAWPSVPAGDFLLTAVATDNDGASTTSAPVLIHVRVNQKPTVQIVAPDPGASFVAPAQIQIVADASDPDGRVRRVSFYATSSGVTSLIGVRFRHHGRDWDWDAEDTEAAHGHTQRFTFNWQNVSAGHYVLTAVATDDNGESTTSAPVPITVTPPPPPTGNQLVQPANLVYVGSFRVPSVAFDASAPTSTFEYGGDSPAFNPKNGSLFMVGHDQGQLVAEITIPAAVPPAVAGDPLAPLPTATFLAPAGDPSHPFFDITQGKLDDVTLFIDALGNIESYNPNANIHIGGMLPDGDNVYVAGYDIYDGSGNQTNSHFVAGPNFALPNNVTGPFQVGNFGPGAAGVIDGYMAVVPAASQSALGGRVLAGNCCLNVIFRTSSGPAASAIDPSQIGVVVPAPAKQLLGYSLSNPLNLTEASVQIGDIHAFNGTTQVTGLVVPDGWRSALFFGRQGVGQFCYGPGTTDPSLAGQLSDNGIDPWCYDPVYPNEKGNHAAQYVSYVWAYDLLDLQAVANGAKQVWEVLPYATWQLNIPASLVGDPTQTGGEIGGATYNPATGELFVVQRFGDGVKPIVNKYVVQ
jgi:Big-like domain-containing protein